jgi:hypothetical protein
MARKLLLEFRRGTAASWTAANPVLAAGEPAWESDTNKMKIGDGVTAWNALAYFGGTSGVSSLDGITGAVSLVAGANVTVTDNAPSAGKITIASTGGGAAAGITVKRYHSKPAGNITRASTVVGAFSTAWQIADVVVAAGQNVRLSMSAAASDGGLSHDRNYTFKRGATTIAAETFNGNVFVNTLEWIDENPGAGTYTYEVQAAEFVSGTLTVFQTLPSTDVAGGSSIFVADVYNP